MAVETPAKATRKPYMDSKVSTRNSEDSTLRMSLTGTATTDDVSNLPPTPTMAGKRKQPELNSAGKFKVVSQMVIAMRRFQASLNPTYTFGKRADSTGSSGQTSGWVRDSPEGSSAQEADSLSRGGSLSRTLPNTDQTDSRKNIYSSRGKKTNYLLRPLPPAERERRQASEHSDGL